MKTPPLYFFLPEQDHPPFHDLPEADQMALHPGRFLSPSLNWVWRTYHHLAADGVACRLVTSLPEEGLIVAAGCNLPLLFRPTGRQFIVSCVADSPPLFFAPCQLFQSVTQAERQTQCLGFPLNVHVPHWPQPGLLPRDEDRGSVFRHIDYFGARNQLAAGLCSPAFAARLRTLDLELRCNFEHYHDYRTTDAVVAVRAFDGRVVTHKPASKLVNAWLAGVPAVLGAENGFRELRTSPLDYIETSAQEEVWNALVRLREDAGLRDAMAAHGRRRAAAFSVPALTEKWRRLLTGTLPPAQERWRALPEAQRRLFFLERASRRVATSLARRCRLANR